MGNPDIHWLCLSAAKGGERLCVRLTKNSQRSEGLKAASEHCYLLMVGLCPAPNGPGKKACVTCLPNAGWLGLSLQQDGLGLVDQEMVHTSQDVLEPEMPSPPSTSIQRDAPLSSGILWVGVGNGWVSPSQSPQEEHPGRVRGPGQHTWVGWPVKLLPVWPLGLFPQRHMEQPDNLSWGGGGRRWGQEGKLRQEGAQL